MNHDEQDYYEFVCDEQMKRLKEAIDAKDAALNAKDAALSTAKEELARYQAMYGPLPSQQPPAAPRA
ncbi:MAG: hypothetical protein IJ228_08060 [Succinivibrio sp.]|nr:hypothetical protein [Succinivibrio sp.]